MKTFTNMQAFPSEFYFIAEFNYRSFRLLRIVHNENKKLFNHIQCDYKFCSEQIKTSKYHKMKCNLSPETHSNGSVSAEVI